MANSHLQFEASIDLDRDRNQWYSICCYNLDWLSALILATLNPSATCNKTYAALPP